jgi:hypothetical protein
MRMKGFDPKWCKWIQEFITLGSVGIRVNDDIGHYFQTRKGLQLGDPLSPILFNIIISTAKDDGQVSGFIPHQLMEGCQFFNIRMI